VSDEEQKQPKTEAAEEAQAEETAQGKAADEAGRARRGIGRRRRKKEDADEAAPEAEAVEDGDDADAAKQAADEQEAEAEAAEAEGEPEPEEEDATPAAEGKAPRRRGASEVSAGRKRQPATPPPRTPDGAIAVRARAKYVRCAPRKARLVIDHIRGKPVEQARAILLHTPRAASRDVLKLLDSAVANAENNHELVADELVVGQAFVDEGPTLKRYRPRALGRATRIRKRTSHMTITLTTTENGR
jgi:ribosomal protein L22